MTHSKCLWWCFTLQYNEETLSMSLQEYFLSQTVTYYFQSATFISIKLVTGWLDLASPVCSGLTCLGKSVQWENETRLWNQSSLKAHWINSIVLRRYLWPELATWPQSRRQAIFKIYWDPPLTTATLISETGRGNRKNAALTSWQQSLGTGR